ncbi:hypothetical protein EMCG_01714 [[Emmonsia] crescens]|uniref:Uncharacterized protein n=1 Tax=[Emmonsia] crescens TaxID=73230 RepID=A0A0G2I1F2_9EURO|nr:hypothetical protein EMCG_01714 [Emmonsia crescens UAMH 3008]
MGYKVSLKRRYRSRFNKERILCAIRNNPNVGNVWFDYGDERSDVSLFFTIISAADMGGRTRLLYMYIFPEWRDVLAVAQWRIALDRYQVLLADSDVKGDIHMELTVVVEYLINLLERQGCNITGLPVDWKE